MQDRGITITRIPRDEPPCDIYYDAATGMYLVKMVYTAEFLEPLLHPETVLASAPASNDCSVTIHIPAKEFVRTKDDFVRRLLEAS